MQMIAVLCTHLGTYLRWTLYDFV